MVRLVLTQQQLQSQNATVWERRPSAAAGEESDVRFCRQPSIPEHSFC
jgi:hypothetical protein